MNKNVKRLRQSFPIPLCPPQFFAWLVAKCRQTATALQSAGGEGIRSLDEPARLLYAIGLLGEYISDVRHRALLKFFDLEAAAQEGEVLRTVDPVAFGDGGGGGSNKKPRLDPKVETRLAHGSVLKLLFRMSF